MAAEKWGAGVVCKHSSVSYSDGRHSQPPAKKVLLMSDQDSRWRDSRTNLVLGPSLQPHILGYLWCVYVYVCAYACACVLEGGMTGRPCPSYYLLAGQSAPVQQDSVLDISHSQSRVSGLATGIPRCRLRP